MTESKDHSNSFWALPIHKNQIKELKKMFGVKRNKEPGVSIVIPFINTDVTLDKIREVVCKSYRIPILREKLKVQIGGGDEINEETIYEIYKKHYCNDAQEEKLTDEYFNFINKIKNNKFDAKDIIINPSRPTSLTSTPSVTASRARCSLTRPRRRASPASRTWLVCTGT